VIEMLNMTMIVLILLILYLYNLSGKLVVTYYPFLKGFELIIGFFITFTLFHLLSIIPTLLNSSVQMLYLITYPLLGLFFIFCFIYTYQKRRFKINYFLSIIILSVVMLFFLFDFIIPGDSAFYLSLIRFVSTSKNIYTIEPWSGMSGHLGYMYYFVTYELFIGSLAHLFRIDSTIFTIHVVTTVHLVIIFTTTYTFLHKIIHNNKMVNYAFIIYLYLFFFLNTNLHRVFFTHNAFNIVTLPYAGKTIYLNGIMIFIFYLINRIVTYQNIKDILLLGLMNLILPGLSASALYLQLIITITMIIYLFIYKHDKDNYFYGLLMLILLLPLMMNYQFILFAPDFYLSTRFTIGIEIIFITIIFIGLFLTLYKKHMISFHHVVITKIFYISLILISCLSFGSGIYLLLKRSNEVSAAFKLLPNIGELFYLYGYHLIVFYLLAIISLFHVHQKYPQYRFLFYSFIIIIILVFLNPFTYPLVGSLITSFATYHRIVYLLPLHFMIVLYLIDLENKKTLFLWFIAILIPLTTIFYGLNPIYKNDVNFYYKVPQDIVDIGQKLSKPYRIMTEETILSELPMVTTHYEFIFTVANIRQVEYDTYQNDELFNLYRMINNKSVFNAHTFLYLVKKYQIECIIVYQNNPINQEIQKLYQSSVELSSKNIKVYLLNP